MTFRELRQKNNIYLLNKQDMTFEEATVDGIGIPRYDAPKVGQTSIAGQVVDVTIKGVCYTVQCDNSVAYSDKVVFATDKAMLLPEVKRLKTEAETLLSGVEKARETIGKCDTLLCELDTAFKEKQETDKRMGAMESKINSLSEMMKNFIDEFKK